MTRSDAIKLIGLIVTTYPNSDKYSSKNAIDDAINAWTEFLADDDVVIVAMALKKHISICKWPPSIAEIKEIIFEICSPDIIPPDEAWAVVAMYIDNSSEYEYLSEPEEYFPTAIAMAIRAVDYRTLRDLRIRRYDHSNKKTGLDRVAFMQAYEPIFERERKNAMLPVSLRKAITHTQITLAGESRKLFDKTRNYLESKRTEKLENRREIQRIDRMTNNLLERHDTDS